MTAVALVVLLMPSAGLLAFADGGNGEEPVQVEEPTSDGGSESGDPGASGSDESGESGGGAGDSTDSTDSINPVDASKVHFELKPSDTGVELSDIQKKHGGSIYYNKPVTITATVYVPKDQADNQNDGASFIRRITVDTEGIASQTGDLNGWAASNTGEDAVKGADDKEYVPFSLDVAFTAEKTYDKALTVTLPAATSEGTGEGDGTGENGGTDGDDNGTGNGDDNNGGSDDSGNGGNGSSGNDTGANNTGANDGAADSPRVFTYTLDGAEDDPAGFTVDTTRPTVTFGMPENRLLSEADGVQSYLKGAKWSATVSDTNLDADSAKAYDAADGTDDSQLKDLGATWENASDPTSRKAQFTIESEEAILPYVVVSDYAGNVAKVAYQVSSADTKIRAAADDEAPSVKAVFDGTVVDGLDIDGRDCLSALTTVTVNANNIDADVAGKLVFTSLDGRETKAYDLSAWQPSGGQADGVDYTGPYTGSATVNALGDGSYAVSITVRVKNNRTLTYSYGSAGDADALALPVSVGSEDDTRLEKDGFILDTAAPVISAIEWSGTKLDPDGDDDVARYKDNALTATLTVTDAHLQENGLKIEFDPSQDPAVANAGAWAQDASDPTLWKRTVTFKPETDVTQFKVTAEDQFGHKADAVDSGKFEIDSKSPEVTFEHGAKTGADGKLWFDDAHATVTVTVSDAHFTTDGSTVTVFKETGATGGSRDATNWTWDAASKTATCTVELVEGDQSIQVVAKDTFGNPTTTKVLDNLVVDRTKPTVKVQFPENVASASKENASFLEGIVDFFTSLLPGANNVTVTVTDANFDPKNTTYTWGDETGAVVETGTWSAAWTKGEGENEWTNTLSLPAGSESAYRTLLVTSTDLAGNTQSDVGYAGTSTDRPDSKFVVQDTTAPVVSIKMSAKPSGEDSANDMYDAAVQATVTVVDAFFNPAASVIVATGHDNVTGSAWTRKGNTSEWSATLEFGESSGNTITVTARDFSKNQAEATYADAVYDGGETEKKVGHESFTVDATDPVITITIDPSVAGTDSAKKIDYYNGDVRAKITLVEANLDMSKTSVLVNGAERKNDLQPKEGASDTYELEVSFTEENDEATAYTISASAADRAGREAALAYGGEGVKAGESQVEGEKFVIDKTKPVVSIDFTEKVVGTETQNGAPYTDYFNKSVTATVTVVEKNFNPSNATVYFNGAAVGEELQHVEGDTYRYARTFTDGVDAATLNASVTDWAQWGSTIAYGDTSDSNGAGTGVLAGGDQVTGKNFTVDTTRPVISISIDRTIARTVGGTDFFSEDVTATVTVVEKHLRDQTVTVNNSSQRQLTKLPGSNDTWAVQIPFSESDDNTISVALTDWATWTATMKYGDSADSNGGGSGTRAGGSQVRGTKFTIDKTPVEVSSIVFDKALSVPANTGDNTTNIDYFTEETVATITVRDKYFDSESATITVQGGTVVGSGGAAWQQSTSDSSIWTAQVRFDEGVGKSLSLAVADYAGNSSSAVSRNKAVDSAGKLLVGETFTVDCTNPTVVSVQVDQALSNTVDGTDYFRSVTDGVLTITVSVRDVNFNPAKSAISRDGQEQGNIWRRDSSDASLWTARLQYGEGVNHDFSLALVDYATRTCTYKYGDAEDGNGVKTSTQDSAGKSLTGSAFSIDLTDPVISISFARKVARQDADFQTDYFNRANSDKLLVATVTVRDVNFWNDAQGYAFDTDGTVVSKNGVVWTSNGASAGKVATWTAKVTFKEGANHTLGVRITDKARNSSSYAYGQREGTTDSKGTVLDNPKFTLDLTAPKVPSASTTKSESGNYKDEYLFYKDKTTVTIKVTDNIGMLSLKLEDRYYKIDNIDKFKPGSKSFTVKIGLSDKAEFDRDIVLTVTDLASNNRTWTLSKNGTIKESGKQGKVANDSISKKGDIHPRAAVQDTVDPKLSLSGVEAGKYYASNRTLAADIDEKNFKYVKTYDPSQTIVSISFRAGEAGASERVTKVPASKFGRTAKGRYHNDILLTKDGHYTISAQVTDPAGNKVSRSIGQFTIDKTAPTCTVTFDNNDSLNGMYYKANRVATITVREHNFDASRFKVSTSGTMGSWSSNGDVHTMTVSYTSDGRYELNVSGSDMAGNAMASYASGTFVIDTTAPRIEFRNVKKNRAYNGRVAPTVAYIDDANFNSNGTRYTLTGNKVGEADYETGTADIGNGETLNFADFEHDAEVDDIYTLKASMEDLAGNEASGSITFSVNRFGSTFRVVDEEEYQNGYLPEARTVEIEEINVSGCKPSDHTAAVTRGRETAVLERHQEEQDTGYTVEGDENDDEWSVYRYAIAPGNFSDDGEYRVDVLSKDTAGNRNRMSNYYDSEDADAVADATVSFVIDRKAPVLIGLNVEEGQVYEEPSKVVRYAINDNIRVKNASLELDGEVVEPTQTSAGNYEIEVPAAAFTPHSLNIVASDYANQELRRGIEQFRVTTDFFELHLPIFIALVVGVLAIAAGVAFFVIRGRRAARAKQGQ